jgi:elongation factor 1-gamma
LKYDQDVLNEAEKVTKDMLKMMESHLVNNTWLVSKFISLADVILAATLLNAFRIVFDDQFRKTFPNTTRWFNTVVNQTPFRDTVGKVFLCQVKQVPSDAPKDQRKGSQEQRKGISNTTVGQYYLEKY